ncbi:hypothetical protein NDU88_007572 [Pleurodeles waltl]|uniref:Uncharacterized protein n=1 Tax=Pleurodeles waltl TaxID=8319 RepID=A0AAV7RPV7_PLEWA|nr:hypothetical protein NDU88_007572 [Pleurodeles waltl]
MQSRSQEAPGSAPELEADSPPAGAPTRRSDLHSPLLSGPASESDPGRSTPPNPGSRPQSGGDLVGPGPRRGARVRRRPPPGPRPSSSSPGRTGRSPSVLRHREPPSPACPGSARRQGRGLSAVPGSPSHSGARSRGRDRTSAVPPVRSSRPSPL